MLSWTDQAMEGGRREPARVQASDRPSDRTKYDPNPVPEDWYGVVASPQQARIRCLAMVRTTMALSTVANETNSPAKVLTVADLTYSGYARFPGAGAEAWILGHLPEAVN